MSWKWHPKPSPSDFCSSCNHFEVSQDQFATILCSSPKMALSGPKRTQNGLKWPEPIEIAIWNHLQWISASLAVILSGHMTSLRQFWVWGQIWLKVAKNGQKRPQMTQIRLNIWIMTSETIFIGFLLLLQSFWVVTWPVYDNFEFLGQNWPKMAEKGPKWPKMAWMSQKWHPKPSPLNFCFSCGHFEWSHD